MATTVFASKAQSPPLTICTWFKALQIEEDYMALAALGVKNIEASRARRELDFLDNVMDVVDSGDFFDNAADDEINNVFNTIFDEIKDIKDEFVDDEINHDKDKNEETNKETHNKFKTRMMIMKLIV